MKYGNARAYSIGIVPSNPVHVILGKIVLFAIKHCCYLAGLCTKICMITEGHLAERKEQTTI